MTDPLIIVEKEDHLTIVTINRPEAMNSISPPVSAELSAAFDEFAANADEWVCIVTGAGERAFSAGNDLKWQAQNGGEELSRQTARIKGGFGGITSRYDCFKPIIAAVNGFALGGGFEVALACDIILAAEHATFGFPEPRVGMIAGAMGVHRLPRHIPYHLAMGMLLSSKRIAAQEAMQYGLVNEVVPLKDLLPTAKKWAAEIMMGAPLALQATKEAALKGLAYPLDEVPKVFPMQEAMHTSEDFIEGPKAFAEKRPPQWKGR
ncbi:MAG: enoyl-CoA hydratase/isomerase family protein [Deltaproteobacteria bacterium]|nr:enoyl-CoA hydratase/isomerase family protein [Deltaproteobacteria bacterium]